MLAQPGLRERAATSRQERGAGNKMQQWWDATQQVIRSQDAQMQKKQISKFFSCLVHVAAHRGGKALRGRGSRTGSEALRRKHRKHVLIAAHQARGEGRERVRGEGGRGEGGRLVTIRRSKNPRRGDFEPQYQVHSLTQPSSQHITGNTSS